MFTQAKPIYLKGKADELNSYAVFAARVDKASNVTLTVTASSFYRVTVGGVFVGYGPARTAKGYARADEYVLDAYLTQEKNELVIEVEGFCCYSLSTVRQHSFLMAEVVKDGQVLAYTGKDFQGYASKAKRRKVDRYSVQRHFTEIWDMVGRTKPYEDGEQAEVEVLDLGLTVLDRIAPYPFYQDVALRGAKNGGTLTPIEGWVSDRRYYSFDADDFWGAFPAQEIESRPFEWLCSHVQTVTKEQQDFPITLTKNEYVLLDFAQIEAGFLTFSADSEGEASVAIGFSEFIGGDTFANTDINTHAAIQVNFDGRVDFASFEPYVCRYAIVAVQSGKITLSGFGVKRFEADTRGVALPQTGDKALDDICVSALRTYAHNAVDLYTDCPSRERAGWLCDTYFTAKVEYELYGKVPTEEAFLQNYRLYRNEGEYPEGMIPMCYPSDAQKDRKFIPQWSMWYLLELEEYLILRNLSADKEEFRASVNGLLAFYAEYENGDGLLERLPSWNFVEWSVANDWTWDVNYPTNFLYAQVLDKMASLYGYEELRAKAVRVREAAIAQSFDGILFHDHAVRNEKNELVLQNDVSEACQYYAALFGGLDSKNDKYAAFYHKICKTFTERKEENMAGVAQVNAFIGLYLRLETLLQEGEYAALLKDVVSFFGKMSKTTNTLWEYRTVHGSLDHAFASYALVAVRKALDGLKAQKN